ncbi:hypothetical protein CATMIT_01696, partial [Catenibacterium mitsuokai DSM 15897]
MPGRDRHLRRRHRLAEEQRAFDHAPALAVLQLQHGAAGPAAELAGLELADQRLFRPVAVEQAAALGAHLLGGFLDRDGVVLRQQLVEQLDLLRRQRVQAGGLELLGAQALLQRHITLGAVGGASEDERQGNGQRQRHSHGNNSGARSGLRKEAPPRAAGRWESTCLEPAGLKPASFKPAGDHLTR